jgi:uncharacterized protein Smg (DUF494 family)
MKHSLVELVDVIIRRIQERPDALPSEKGIRSWLSSKGYKKSEIDAALKLVRPRVAEVVPGFEGYQTTARTLTVYEECKLSPEARSALARLDVYGLLAPYEREMILEQLNHYEGEVGLEELDDLLSWMVCSNHDVEFQQTFYNVFEGKNETLH